MQLRRPNQRLARAVAVSFLTAVAVTAISPAGASAISPAGASAATVPAIATAGAAATAPCEAWTGGGQPPDPGGTDHNNYLWSVAVLSPYNAWAVGDYDPTQTLIVHWNGSAWKQVKTPNPGGSARNNDLMAVTVTPKGDAWAAGQFATGTGMRTLVLHLDGSAWRREPAPSFGDSVIDDTLTAVGASPDASSVWAVGHYYDGTAEQTLAMHCC